MNGLTRLEHLLRRVPSHMQVEPVATPAELLAQVSLEIWNAENGSVYPRWTAAQIRRAKALREDVRALVVSDGRAA